MNINNKIIATTGVGGAALFIVLAANIKPFLEGLSAVPAMVTAFASQMPLGAGSFLLALAACPLLFHFLDRWLPCKHSDRQGFLAEFMTLGAGVGVTVAQQWGGTGSEMVFPIMLGAVAGLAGPLITKGLRSLFKEKGDVSVPKSD